MNRSLGFPPYFDNRFTSVLAQIEIASCFRNDKEPLFQILSPLIYATVDL